MLGVPPTLCPLLAQLGAALLAAKISGGDIGAAVEAAIGWNDLGREVDEARKLIRPDLSELKEQYQGPKTFRARKPVPPEQTNAESFYYLKQMTNKTKMVIVLKDGEHKEEHKPAH